jgi:hypothetical protein
MKQITEKTTVLEIVLLKEINNYLVEGCTSA